MTVKLLMSWDILPGREQEYFEFVVRDFIPSLQKLGMEPNDAWYTYYGDQPQILTSAILSNKSAITRVLQSNEWVDLTHQLMDYVENFKYKIVNARGGFQL